MNEVEAAKTLDIFFNPNKANKKWKKIDELEKYLSNLPVQRRGILEEIGTPGLYVRKLTLPAETTLTSCIHKSHHQFVITKGAIAVYNTITDEDNIFYAGHHGITYPGTRRVLHTFAETIWMTFHANDKIKFGFELLDKQQQQVIFDDVFTEIIQQYYNPALNPFDEGMFI